MLRHFLTAVGRWLYELGAHAVMRPFQPFRGFFLMGYLLLIPVWLIPGLFSAWPGYTALAHAGASAGPGRFLIDLSFLLAGLSLLVVCYYLSPARLTEANALLDANRVHRYPVIGASFFFVQYPWLLLGYEARGDWVYDLTGSLVFLSYAMPWFAYLFANSFVVLVIRFWRLRQTRRIAG